VAYRLSGGQPDPTVSDDVLADRIRSTLGPLEKRFDVPRIHVMVEDHVALLHGEVPSVSDRAAVEWAVVQVSGVRGLESYLHVGLLPGDTRPSEGRARAAATPSPALRDLLGAAGEAGVPTEHRTAAVRAVLGAFTARIPEGERAQLLGHLPADVRALADVPHFEGAALARIRTVHELVHAVTSSTIPAEQARIVTSAVLAELRRLVPEEAADVAAVLPAELQQLWADPRRGRSAVS
jgi:uncharacterized protein (DUF2267 family)